MASPHRGCHMKVQLIEGISGTYEDNATPLYAGPGDVIDISAEWAQRLIEAGIAVAVQEEPKKPTTVKVK
jgi:hypothetical protein